MTLVVFGGNGPVHAGMQAAELGIRRIFVPKLSPRSRRWGCCSRSRRRRNALLRDADRARRRGARERALRRHGSVGGSRAPGQHDEEEAARPVRSA
jgi:N-methylhydantoinase A/oxoprolinase/acetone carboxylase beta subunit